MNLKKLLLLFSVLMSWMLVSGTLNASNDDDDETAGAVFTMNNATSGNEVLVFARGDDGGISQVGSVATGGLGSGGGLGNQGGLVLSKNHRWLFAVNAGSDEISVFAVHRDHLQLRDKIHSGGVRPVSLTFDRGLLYVLNAGSDDISGFTLSRHGKLSALPGSTRSLSGTGTAPAQIQFDPNGSILVVTEKATNLIDTFVVDDDGLPGNANSFASVGATPFGFAFDRRGRLVVSEAAGGAPDASSVSSYQVSDDGVVTVIDGAVPTTETAACWVAISDNGRYAYTTNTGSSSLTGYRIARDGSLSLLDADGATGDTGAGSAPIDLAFSGNSRFIYSLSAANGSISAFKVGKNGSLTTIGRIEGIPGSLNGLAAY